MKKICDKCGKRVSKNVSFCPNCGNQISSEEEMKQKELAEEQRNFLDEKEPNKDRKRYILPILFLVLLVVFGFFVIRFFFFTNDLDKVQQPSDSEYEKNEFLGKYEEYLLQNTLSKYDQITGTLLDFDQDGIPELVIQYENSNQYNEEDEITEIIYIRGDTVRASEEYEWAYITVLHEVESEQANYYIQQADWYNDTRSTFVPIMDILSEEATIRKLEDWSDNFNYQYIKPSIQINRYDITKSDIKNDLLRLLEKSKKDPSYYGSTKEEETKNKIKELKNTFLKTDGSTIYDAKNKVTFGTYTDGEKKITINSDNTAQYQDKWGESSGTFQLEYDKIVFSFQMQFKIIGDNQLQQDDTLWTLAK